MEGLEIPTEFAALGASNAFQMHGVLPGDMEKLLAFLDVIGTESGDDGTLELAGKGYTAADILEQCRKLDEAGIEYYFVYMILPGHCLSVEGEGFCGQRIAAFR